MDEVGSWMKGYLPAAVLQLLGVLLLAGSVVFWAATGHESALFVGAAMSLIGLGAYQGLRITVRVEGDRNRLSEGPPPPDEPDEE